MTGQSVCVFWRGDEERGAAALLCDLGEVAECVPFSALSRTARQYLLCRGKTCESTMKGWSIAFALPLDLFPTAGTRWG